MSVDRLHWLRGLVASLAMVACLLSHWWLTAEIAALRAVGVTEFRTPIHVVARWADLFAQWPPVMLAAVFSLAAAALLAFRPARSVWGIVFAWLATAALVSLAAHYAMGLYLVPDAWTPQVFGLLSE